MTEYRATLRTAHLEIHVKKSATLLQAEEKLRAKAQAVTDAIEALPDFARPVLQIPPLSIGLSYAPEHGEFLDALPWADIRAEFARKAKKIGLTAPHDVSVMDGDGHVTLWCVAK